MLAAGWRTVLPSRRGAWADAPSDRRQIHGQEPSISLNGGEHGTHPFSEKSSMPDSTTITFVEPDTTDVSPRLKQPTAPFIPSELVIG